MLIQDQFVQHVGDCRDRAAEKHLNGRSPLGSSMTVFKIIDGDCFLPTLRTRRSNPAQRQLGLNAEWLTKVFTVWKNRSYRYASYYGAITHVQHFQTASKVAIQAGGFNGWTENGWK